MPLTNAVSSTAFDPFTSGYLNPLKEGIEELLRINPLRISVARLIQELISNVESSSLVTLLASMPKAFNILILTRLKTEDLNLHLFIKFLALYPQFFDREKTKNPTKYLEEIKEHKTSSFISTLRECLKDSFFELNAYDRVTAINNLRENPNFYGILFGNKDLAQEFFFIVFTNIPEHEEFDENAFQALKSHRFGTHLITQTSLREFVKYMQTKNITVIEVPYAASSSAAAAASVEESRRALVRR